MNTPKELRVCIQLTKDSMNTEQNAKTICSLLPSAGDGSCQDSVMAVRQHCILVVQEAFISRLSCLQHSEIIDAWKRQGNLGFFNCNLQYDSQLLFNCAYHL